MDTQSSIIHYCRYQERCHAEVRNKLYDLGCYTKEVEELIALMVTMDLLNEERFARSFARGKFRMKQWGRVKIKHELKAKKVSEYCIRKAMTEIDEEDYVNTLKKLAEKKIATLKGEHPIAKRGKTIRYLAQKGFEQDMINDVLKEMTASKF
jgi:regulatory protein